MRGPANGARGGRRTSRSGRPGAGNSAAPGEEAGDRARTGDPQLGKLMLYQLSYARKADLPRRDGPEGAGRTARPARGGS